MPKAEKKKTNGKKNLDTAIIVAIIGLIGTMAVGILNSPIIAKLLDRASASPTPVETNPPPNAGQLLFSEDFEDNAASGFAFELGEWEIVEEKSNFVLKGAATESDTPAAKAYFGPNDFTDGIIEFQCRFLKPIGLYVDFHFQADKGGHFLNLSPEYESIFLAAITFQNGKNPVSVISSQSFTFQQDTWYKVRLTLRESQMTLDVDGNRILSAPDSRFETGVMRFTLDPDTVVELDDVKVWSLKP
jgi:hypothetical protein